MIEFDFENTAAIIRIADRAQVLRTKWDRPMTEDEMLSLRMSLAAANGKNGNPKLDLDAIMNADDFNFSHDVFGIERHMDTETGKIANFFRPRMTLREAA